VFRGQWTVLSFGFTNCTLACPMLHGEIFRSSEKLASRGVKYLTISVDPEHDTVEQMAGYMKPWGVQNDAWTFARVDREMVRALLAGLQMPDVSEDPSQSVALPGGGTMANIQHPTRFFVVGPDATVRGLWRGSDPDDVDAMVRWILHRVF
jgi:protein SCO1/2